MITNTIDNILAIAPKGAAASVRTTRVTRNELVSWKAVVHVTSGDRLVAAGNGEGSTGSEARDAAWEAAAGKVGAAIE